MTLMVAGQGTYAIRMSWCVWRPAAHTEAAQPWAAVGDGGAGRGTRTLSPEEARNLHAIGAEGLGTDALRER